MKLIHHAPLVVLAFLLAPASQAQMTRYLDPVFQQIDIQSNIVYGSAFNPLSGQQETLLLDRYEPAGDSAPARPAIVIVHGGGFLAGSKSDPPNVETARQFASRGYLAVSIDYRLAQSNAQKNANFPLVYGNAAEDYRNAVQFVRQNAAAWGVDTSRIVGLGGSAGAATCLEGSYLEENPTPAISSDTQVVIDLWGHLPSLTSMMAGDAPLMIVHGTADPVVPFQNAIDLRDRAQAVGVPISFNPLPGVGHAPWGAFFSTYLQPSVEFCYEHLRLAQLSGLVLRPGLASPGNAVLDSFGLPGELRILALAAASASIPIAPFGTLCLDPSTLVLLPAPPFPGASGIVSQLTSIPVPAGIAGVEIPIQELHLSPSGPIGLLTNCVTASF